MRIIDNLYTTGIKEKKLKKIKNKIHSNSKLGKLKKAYVVTLPLCKDGLLEVYVYDQLLQPYYISNFDVCVIGIADTKESAMGLVTDIIQQSYDAGYGLDICGFLGV